MPRPSWYLQRGVCATAVTSLVGLVHPNIQRSCRRKVVGTGPLSSRTVASIGSSPFPFARYQSCSAWRGSGGSKSRLAKAAGAEPAGQMRDEKVHAIVARSTFGTKHLSVGPLLEVAMPKKCTPLWHEAHFEVKMYKTHQVRTTFGSCDVEKVHAVVARSTFRSQNVQNTSALDHFWKLRCWKKSTSLWRKHISKSKCTKHTMLGPLLEVQMSKKCTALWREAHFEVKIFKTLGVRTTFGGSDVASLRYTTLHYTTLHYTTLQEITLHYTPVHYITLHYTPLHSTTLNYTTPHYITLH